MLNSAYHVKFIVNGSQLQVYVNDVPTAQAPTTRRSRMAALRS